MGETVGLAFGVCFGNGLKRGLELEMFETMRFWLVVSTN
jgi:hypothetical protein